MIDGGVDGVGRTNQGEGFYTLSNAPRTEAFCTVAGDRASSILL